MGGNISDSFIGNNKSCITSSKQPGEIELVMITFLLESKNILRPMFGSLSHFT